jgi:ADP-ribosyl-[dinitrogen reductase] hydrolase
MVFRLPEMELTRSDRIRGAVLGLLAGDKIGGPSRMALELAESLIGSGRYDAADVIGCYKAWYDKEGFDTGQIAEMVFRRMNTLSNNSAVMDADEYVGGLTAGCNPVHRALPLALVSFVDESELIEIADAEARLTHRHPMAGAVSGTYLKIVRELIAGSASSVFDIALEASPADLRQYLNDQWGCAPSRGGYAPDVLHAALHFTNTAASFEEALESAVGFAGPTNYCPVLVGAIAGARFGCQAINTRNISHCCRSHLERAEKIGHQLARTW